MITKTSRERNPSSAHLLIVPYDTRMGHLIFRPSSIRLNPEKKRPTPSTAAKRLTTESVETSSDYRRRRSVIRRSMTTQGIEIVVLQNFVQVDLQISTS